MTKRWFPEGQQDWRAEKAESEPFATTSRLSLLESPSFDPRTCTTCSEPARGCTCCKFCNEPAVAVRLCTAHHRDEVEREQAESTKQAAWLVAQMHMVAS